VVSIDWPDNPLLFPEKEAKSVDPLRGWLHFTKNSEKSTTPKESIGLVERSIQRVQADTTSQSVD
jgi:hypothetical protein